MAFFTSLGSEFWSAIAGAIVGGAIAFIIQILSLRAAKNEREQERRDRERALAHSILFKLARIQTNLFNLHLHLEESFAAAHPDRHDDAWSFILPIANAPADVHFSPDEMSFVLSLKMADLTDRIMSLDFVHNSLVEVFKEYKILRSELTSSMPAEMRGNVGETQFTREAWQIVHPKMVVMNDLLAATRRQAEMDYSESTVALQEFVASANEKMGLGLAFELKPEKQARLTEVLGKSHASP